MPALPWLAALWWLAGSAVAAPSAPLSCGATAQFEVPAGATTQILVAADSGVLKLEEHGQDIAVDAGERREISVPPRLGTWWVRVEAHQAVRVRRLNPGVASGHFAARLDCAPDAAPWAWREAAHAIEARLDGPIDAAYPPMSVTIRLEDELDVSRGDLICRPNNAPSVAQDIEAMLCWMDETRPMAVCGRYAIKHTTRSSRAVVRGLHYRLDVNTLHRDESAQKLMLNEIGRVKLRTTVPLLADDYRRNRTTGGFVVIDETTNRTVGAGMIVDAA